MRDKWLCAALMLAVVSSLVSIFVSSLLFVAVILLWLLTGWQSRRFRLQTPPFAPFLLVFVLAVLLSVAFSKDVPSSVIYLKKLIKFFYPFLILTYLTRTQIERVLQGIFLLLGASAAYGILQYYWLMDVHLMNRIRGFMGNWMTFSGQLMLGSVALVVYTLFYQFQAVRITSRRQGNLGKEQNSQSGGRKRKSDWFVRFGWLALLLLLLFALVLTLTRSAWLGFFVGLLTVLVIYRLSWALMAFSMVVIVFFSLPAHFQQRFYSAFDPKDVTTRIRIELLQTGKNMIVANPWTGIGPRMVPRASAQYCTSEEFPVQIYQHLHNNPVQIGAEMGLIGLAAWAALWVRIFWDLICFTRQGSPAAGDPFSLCLSVAGIGVLTAFLFAGLFEYNFGDSEVLILLLFFVTAPYVVNGRREKTD